MEDRLREALSEAGAAVDTSVLKPLRAPERRFRMDLRWVAVPVVVMLAGAATAAALGARSDDEDRATAVSPPTTVTAKVSVFLCTGSDLGMPPCKAGAATPQQTKTIERALRELPQVERMFFVSRTSAYEDFRKKYAANKVLVDHVKVTDLPPLFSLQLKRGADSKQIQTSVGRMAGVREVVDHAAAAAVRPEKPKWHLNVFLCGSKGPEQPPCAGRKKNGAEGKAITSGERVALEELIIETPGVEEFVFETQAEAYKNFKESFAKNKELVDATRLGDMPQSFRIRLKKGTEWSDLAGELKKQPGVAQVISGICRADLHSLSVDYGLEPLPEEKVCPVIK
ncbi:permease-like cell division protein FtsX [Nonomuraea solani]|uniref:permease-like cell division protein FtsX n=1 Tax=Nonomuraea solani TaxID=1144553 RepID=UPI000CDEB4B4|nr:permease-like cell division protein FtsX [Nonomuraea solani]